MRPGLPSEGCLDQLRTCSCPRKPSSDLHSYHQCYPAKSRAVDLASSYALIVMRHDSLDLLDNSIYSEILS